MGKQIRVVSLAVVALLALVMLAACGESDDETIVGDIATRIPVEGAPTELPTPDPVALTAEAATAEAEEAADAEGAAAEAGGEEQAGGGAAQTVRLEGYDIGWRTPDQEGPEVALTLAPGATIELVNVGAAPHNFQAEDLGINQDMPVGFSGTVTIPADAAPGTYEFICNVPGHAAAGMVGTITIDPNAGANTGAPSGSPAASPAAPPAAGGEEAPTAEAVRLEGYDIGWRTADQEGPQVELTVAPGTVIELANVGAAPHNFQAEDLGINEDMPVGYQGSVTIPADAAPGTYEFICNVPGHAPAGMVGTITIQ